MMNCKLTVIIPTYNAEDHILESVNSLKEQSFGFENIELILVDDNSNDSTKAIIKELSEKHENIKLSFKKRYHNYRREFYWNIYEYSDDFDKNEMYEFAKSLKSD